jgi:hypothetical protein
MKSLITVRELLSVKGKPFPNVYKIVDEDPAKPNDDLSCRHYTEPVELWGWIINL